MNRKTLRAWGMVFGVAIAASLAMAAFSPRAAAVPSFSRKYNVSCAKCHTAVPRLNTYGFMFKLHGYQVANDAMLGKIDTGDPKLQLLQSLPVSVHLNGQIADTSGDGESADFVLDHEFGLIFADTFATDMAMLLEAIVEQEDGEFATELEHAQLTFVGLSHRRSTAFNMQVGTMNLFDWGIANDRRLSMSDYAAYGVAVGENDHLLVNGMQGINIFGMLGGGGGGETTRGNAATQLVSTDPTSALASAPDADAESAPIANYNVRQGIFYQVGVGTPGASDENKLSTFGRLGYSFAHGPTITGFGISGTHALASADEHYDRVGLELMWDLPKTISVGGYEESALMFNAGWISGHDEDPLDGEGSVDHTAQFAEVVYLLSADNAILVRWDRIHSSDLPELNQTSLTADFLYYLKRNIRVGLEGVFNSTGGSGNRFGFFYDILL